MTFNTFDELVALAPKKVQRKLEQLEFLNERPDFHPEPNVREHIRIVTERLMLTGDINLILAGLFHDICKFDTVRKNPKTGWPTSPGHDKYAGYLIRENADMIHFITDLGGDWEEVATLCEQHMRIKMINQMKASKQQALKDLDVYPKLRIFTMADDMLNEFEWPISEDKEIRTH